MLGGVLSPSPLTAPAEPKRARVFNSTAAAADAYTDGEIKVGEQPMDSGSGSGSDPQASLRFHRPFQNYSTGSGQDIIGGYMGGASSPQLQAGYGYGAYQQQQQQQRQMDPVPEDTLQHGAGVVQGEG